MPISRSLATLLLSAPALAQAPGPGIDPTPISSLPFTITAPGAYYVTKELTGVAGSHGIVVAASDVRLNLNGFTLRGVPGSLDGVHLAAGPARTAVAVTNGSLTGWGQDGIDLASCRDVALQGIVVRSSGGHGIRVHSLGALLQDCQAESNHLDGIRVSGQAAALARCVATLNGGVGLATDYGSRIEAGLSQNNGGNGVELGQASTLADSTLSGNGGDGVFVAHGGVVTGCTVDDNASHGIEVVTLARVVGCTARGNGLATGGSGVRVKDGGNVVEGNTVAGNSVGVEVASGGNVVVRNVALQNAVQYSIVAGNLVGPIVDVATMASNTNPQANLSL